MNEDQQDPYLNRLVAAHLALFRGAGPDIPSSVSPGWYELIDKLCTDIEVAAGPVDIAKIRVQQIKEKFGTLRYYWQLDNVGDVHIDVIAEQGVESLVNEVAEPDKELRQRVRSLVVACEKASAETCERCGRPGKLIAVGGWYRTRCEDCKNKSWQDV